jgi:hypothetical protein
MSNDHVPVTVVDRGAFPDDVVRSAHPLPAKYAIENPGRPLLDRVIQDVRELPADPPCPLSPDLLPVVRPHLAPIVDEPTGEPRRDSTSPSSSQRRSIRREERSPIA